MHLDTETSHEPPRTGIKWFDVAIAVGILLVSASSLIVAIVHSLTLERLADANARLVEANSWPYLAYGTGNLVGDRHVIHMSVINEGVGPAKIEAVEIRWQGIAYPDAHEFLKACCGYEYNPADGLQADLVQGRVLPAGKEIEFITLPATDTDKDAWNRLNANRLSSNLNVNMCFCSVFNECWIDDVVTFSLKPVRVKQCTTPKVGFSVPGVK
jgi:hypothetical protein